MLTPDYPIVTERLVLRPFRAEDLEDFHAYRKIPEVARFVPWPVTDHDGSRKALAAKLVPQVIADTTDHLCLAVEVKETGTVVGEVYLFWRDKDNQLGEVGYGFNPAFGGRGYASEATVEMLRLGFAGLGLHRIIAKLDARNSASAKLAERVGMRREALFLQNEYFKGEWTDTLLYAMLASEWEARG